MATQELHHLIIKLQGIQKQLGGPSDGKGEKNTDEFNKVKLALAELINFVSKKQEERDNTMNRDGRNLLVIKANADIRDRLEEGESQIKQMQEVLRRQKKNHKKHPISEIELKERQLANCKKLLEQLKIREEGGPVDEEKPITLTEMKIKLAGNRSNNVTQRDLTQDEAEALQAFKEKDKELDGIILQINDGLDTLREKAETIGERIDTQDNMIENLNKEVTKTAAEMETANKRLRKILFQYRKPGQFCMDVVCLLILLGLIAVIIKLATQSSL